MLFSENKQEVNSNLDIDFVFKTRCQLRRQAMVHADLIGDSMDIQAAELSRKYNLQMEEKLYNERSAHQNEVSKLRGKIGGIENIVREKCNTEFLMLTKFF